MASNCSTYNSSTLSKSKQNREENLRDFEESKIGVKGVLDSGITKLPDIFVLPEEHQLNDSTTINNTQLQVPVIDLRGFDSERRSEITSEIHKASSTWGFFLLINHGIPQEIIQQLVECVQEFIEQPQELKREFYTNDATKKFKYYSLIHPILRTVLWKDTIFCHIDHQSAKDLEALPTLCRKPMADFAECAIRLKDVLSELMSEALGLECDYLKRIECMKDQKLISHYYPACPEPSLTTGAYTHSDPYLLTILVQNHINALQVLYKNQWINVEPEEGAIVVNIGDMLQLISNDIFKSAEHRVLARSIGPRISVGSFFYPGEDNKDRVYEPIKELLQGNVAPVYRGVTEAEYIKSFMTKGINGSKSLSEYIK